MPSQTRSMPNFFILGSRRSGTASLAHYLGQHHAISFTTPRDPTFFLLDDLYQRGPDFYLDRFCRNRGGVTWLGDASSAYYANPQRVGPRLRATYGDKPLKFIVLLREPVSRAWSHYLSRVQHGCETRTFAAALAAEPAEPADSEARYAAEGRYMQLYQAWQEYYPAEDFLFLLSEDLAANPIAQVRRAFMWLGVEPTPPVNVDERLNAARYSNNRRIVNFVNHPPAWLRSFGRRIWPESWQRRRIRHRMREQLQSPAGAPPQLDPRLAHELRESYRDEILALSKHLGRYLSHWLDDELDNNPPGSMPLVNMVY